RFVQINQPRELIRIPALQVYLNRGPTRPGRDDIILVCRPLLIGSAVLSKWHRRRSAQLDHRGERRIVSQDQPPVGPGVERRAQHQPRWTRLAPGLEEAPLFGGQLVVRIQTSQLLVIIEAVPVEVVAKAFEERQSHWTGETDVPSLNQLPTYRRK